MLKNGRKGRGCIGRKGKADSILARKNMRFDASTRTRRKDSAPAGFLTLSSSSVNHFGINGLLGYGRRGLERRPVPNGAKLRGYCLLNRNLNPNPNLDLNLLVENGLRL